ncbi:hypothetical protein CR513_11679, partial [Mucuna pruriens]
MRERFVSSYYTDSKNVKKYHKEMEMDLLRAQIMESKEATVARILNGHYRDIQEIVELKHYITLEDLIHQSTNMELQLKKTNASRNLYSSYSSWKGKEWEKGRSRRKKSPKKWNEISQALFLTSSATKSSSIKCLGKGHIASECPNKIIMVLKEDGEVDSECSCEDSSCSNGENPLVKDPTMRETF